MRRMDGRRDGKKVVHADLEEQVCPSEVILLQGKKKTKKGNGIFIIPSSMISL